MIEPKPKSVRLCPALTSQMIPFLRPFLKQYTKQSVKQYFISEKYQKIQSNSSFIPKTKYIQLKKTKQSNLIY